MAMVVRTNESGRWPVKVDHQPLFGYFPRDVRMNGGGGGEAIASRLQCLATQMLRISVPACAPACGKTVPRTIFLVARSPLRLRLPTRRKRRRPQMGSPPFLKSIALFDTMGREMTVCCLCETVLVVSSRYFHCMKSSINSADISQVSSSNSRISPSYAERI